MSQISHLANIALFCPIEIRKNLLFFVGNSGGKYARFVVKPPFDYVRKTINPHPLRT